MKIGLTGASGFIGKKITALAVEHGHEVIGFTSDPARKIPGCIETRAFVPDERVNVAGCEALIHLAGENVFGFWTREKKRRILRSRRFGTRALVDAIFASNSPPRVLVSGSAIGFYGDTGENPADENAPSGKGFLAEVCREWESEALRARECGARVVLLRTGIVLGKNGGALGAMTTIFKLGLGGKIGSGSQWMSWIHIEDEAALALFAVESENVSGPLNAVAPEPVRNADFTQALARALHRPAFFTVPAFILQALAREFSGELLQSKRVIPRQAIDSNFAFHFPELSSALTDIFPA